ncbi:MAG TPA: zf-HC2 domain-containing protein [Ktedonobacteraceae bacterium]|nr:zf-HC2 domain-containing protein [Ktedonobacteraceae bacterium]
MSNQRHVTGNSAYPDTPHEKMVLLLDAYSTGELERNEQEAVEKHLATCRECQHLLATVQHFRGLFTRLPAYDHEHNQDGETVQMPYDEEPFPLTSRVLDEITIKREKKMRREPIAGILQENHTKNRGPGQRTWRTSLPLIASILCLLLLGSSLLLVLPYFRQPSSGPGTGESRPPTLVWQRQQEQFLAQNTEATFSIKYMDITNQEFRFFYAFRSAGEKIPHVEVVSYLSSDPNTSTTLPTTIQSFGSVGSFNVGVVRARGLNRVGQIITLQITLPGKSTPAWHLAPLKQLFNYPFDSSRTYWGFPIEQAELPAVLWYGPVTKAYVAFFKNTVTGVHLFVRIDDPVAVKIITQKEYLAIAGQQNFF